MNQNDMFVLVLLFLLAVTVIAFGYMIVKYLKSKKGKRRRWARVKVPNQKMITCKIAEPRPAAGDTEYLVNDINVGGLAFFTNKEVEKTMVKLLVRFPFTTFSEASTVWGKVVYCNKFGDQEKFRVGISYQRQKKRSK